MRYAIRNKLTGHLAGSGKVFRKQHRAVKWAYRNLRYIGLDAYEIVTVDVAPVRLTDPNAVNPLTYKPT